MTNNQKKNNYPNLLKNKNHIQKKIISSKKNIYTEDCYTTPQIKKKKKEKKKKKDQCTRQK